MDIFAAVGRSSIVDRFGGLLADHAFGPTAHRPHLGRLGDLEQFFLDCARRSDSRGEERSGSDLASTNCLAPMGDLTWRLRNGRSILPFIAIRRSGPPNKIISRFMRRLLGTNSTQTFLADMNKPNKAPEPTPPLVTIRACARLAPSGVVAHL